MDIETKKGFSKVVVPVRYAAWLNGDLGNVITKTLEAAMQKTKGLGEVRTTRLPRGILVEAQATNGKLTDCLTKAVQRLEVDTAKQYPVFHHELGPVTTGILQVVL